MKKLLIHAWVLVLLTKFVSVPMRLCGATLDVGGAFISVFPVVGNFANMGLDKADEAIDEAADTVDDIPI
jgi:hypothetical protein